MAGEHDEVDSDFSFVVHPSSGEGIHSIYSVVAAGSSSIGNRADQ